MKKVAASPPLSPWRVVAGGALFGVVFAGFDLYQQAIVGIDSSTIGIQIMSDVIAGALMAVPVAAVLALTRALQGSSGTASRSSQPPEPRQEDLR